MDISFRYPIFSPIRLTIPISIVLFIMPFYNNNQAINILIFPIFYMFSFFLILLNIPSVIEHCDTKPIYYEDLIKARFEYINTYQIIHNLFLSILLSGIFYNTVIYNEIIHKNYIDIFALLGGNISLFSSIQSVFNRIFNRFFLTISTPNLIPKKNDDDDIEIIVI